MKAQSINSIRIVRRMSVGIILLAFATLFGCRSPLAPSTPATPEGTAATYAVSFDSQSATVAADPATKTVASPATTLDALPTPPSKTNYNFAGWYTQPNGGGTEFGPASKVAANVTVYAKWSSAPVYTVTYDSLGATVEASPIGKTVTYPDTTVLALPTAPSKVGYLFGGWWTAQSGGAQFTESTLVSASCTVYARWDSYSYTVSFDSAGATTAAVPASVQVASPAVSVGALPAEPTFGGNYFAGWWTAQNGGGAEFYASSAVTADITVYAKWSASPVYALSFDSRGGSSVASQTVVANQRAVAPSSPTRNGYQFEGWYKETSCLNAWAFSTDTVSSDTTLYAKWSAVTYYVSYVSKGGTDAGNPESYTVETATIALQSPTRSGYAFAGWYADSGFSSQVTQIAMGSFGNLTLYAKWNPTSYAIAYELNGGSNGGNPSSYTIETPTITLEPATRSGYIFSGWYADSGFSSQVSQIAQGSMGGLDLYAKWTASYTVSFDSQGATTPASPAAMTVTSPATTVGTLPAQPSRNGYTFGGWYAAPNGGGGSFTASSVVSANIVVYADWNPIGYTIAYVLNGGSNSGSNPATYNVASSTITLAAPTQTGYTFVGWYSDSGFTSQVTGIPQGSTGNRTFYAEWWLSSNTTVATPAFSPAAGSYGSDQSVTLSSATPGATIMYTTDGATWYTYSSPISVSGNGTDLLVTAYATKTGLTDSDVAGAEYVINTVVSAPQVSMTAGTYSSDPTVMISSATPGAGIYYTLDGSAPSTSSTLYTGPISLDPTLSIHLRAIATKDGMTSSSLDAGTYTIDPTRASTPQISPKGGAFTSSQSVSISCFTSGSTIRYTTDGSSPSETNGTVYAGPIGVSSSTSLKAIAYAPGLSDSAIVSAAYSFPAPAAPSTIIATGQAKKISVTWKAVSGAVSYNLYWVKGSTVTKATSGVTKVTNVSSGVVVPSLTNGWVYSFIVTAVNAYGEGSPSAVATTQPHS